MNHERLEEEPLFILLLAASLLFQKAWQITAKISSFLENTTDKTRNNQTIPLCCCYSVEWCLEQRCVHGFKLLCRALFNEEKKKTERAGARTVFHTCRGLLMAKPNVPWFRCCSRGGGGEGAFSCHVIRRMQVQDMPFKHNQCALSYCGCFFPVAFTFLKQACCSVLSVCVSGAGGGTRRSLEIKYKHVCVPCPACLIPLRCVRASVCAVPPYIIMVAVPSQQEE